MYQQSSFVNISRINSGLDKANFAFLETLEWKTLSPPKASIIQRSNDGYLDFYNLKKM